MSTNSRCISETRKLLPIWKHKETLVETIKANQHCIIVSSTGSGKTTQLPQFLFEKNLLSGGIVAITQPRRVAAISVALRVAEEMGRGAIGVGPVGYCVRFEDMSDHRTTRLRYMTDGMLLREAVLDPDLSRYQYVILDEAHERSLNTDMLFGVVLTAAQRRAKALATWRTNPQSSQHMVLQGDSKQKKPLPLLKIIVMSATIDPAPFVNFLGAEHTCVVYIEGRPHPLKVLNICEPSTDYITDAALACIQIHKSKTCPPDRGILIFLTGEDEITRCCALIRELARLPRTNGQCANQDELDIMVFPLFASLPQGRQLQALAFTKQNCRKIIVSTNLAETSITIPGIRYVLDCGFAKVRYWDAKTGLETYRVQHISKSQAWQRAGRAGREAAGVCLRLYTEPEYKNMSLHPQPELLRAPLAGVMLTLVSMNHKVPQRFPWLSRPSEASMDAGVHVLKRLGAIELAKDEVPEVATSIPGGSANHLSMSERVVHPVQLTPLGSLMSAFPLDPRFSRTLLSAAQLGCLIEVLSVISMLYVSPVFYVPMERREQFEEIQQQFRHTDGDLASLLQVYRAYVRQSRARGSRETQIQCGTQVDKSNQSPTQSRQQWCRANCLNRARLDTAVNVRSQLKQIAQGAGLGRQFRSCGADLSCITRAFVDAGFQDQVVILVDSSLSGTLTVPSTPSRLINPRQPIYMRVASAGVLPTSDTQCYFGIHPESQLYLSAFSAPPPKLLFIESLLQGGERPEITDGNSRLVYMRQVAVVPAGPLDSNNSLDVTTWLNRTLGINSSDCNIVASGSKHKIRDVNRLSVLHTTSHDHKSHCHGFIESHPKRVCRGDGISAVVVRDNKLTALTRRQRRRLSKQRKKTLVAPDAS
ncbi:ATP-dependent RNA helicase DHX33 [Paragonimus westermani]|uniref:RNA helicase n=1 Tax=Paragonimus westermani TaxID=34504 RepID=A0A5J4NL58_9TREM|nr:ATP-dependent RNA helicase DHX33 [Paragonimus westermani]